MGGARIADAPLSAALISAGTSVRPSFTTARHATTRHDRAVQDCARGSARTGAAADASGEARRDFQEGIDLGKDRVQDSRRRTGHPTVAAGAGRGQAATASGRVAAMGGGPTRSSAAARRPARAPPEHLDRGRRDRSPASARSRRPSRPVERPPAAVVPERRAPSTNS